MSIVHKLYIYNKFCSKPYAISYLENYTSSQLISTIDGLNLVLLIHDVAHHSICIAHNYLLSLECRHVDFREFESLIEPTTTLLQDEMSAVFNGFRREMVHDQNSTLLDLVLLLNDCKNRIRRKVRNANFLITNKFPTYGLNGRFIFQYIVDAIKEILQHPRYSAPCVDDGEGNQGTSYMEDDSEENIDNPIMEDADGDSMEYDNDDGCP